MYCRGYGPDRVMYPTPPNQEGWKKTKTDTHCEGGTEAIPEGLATGRTAAAVAVSAA